MSYPLDEFAFPSLLGNDIFDLGCWLNEVRLDSDAKVSKLAEAILIFDSGGIFKDNLVLLEKQLTGEWSFSLTDELVFVASWFIFRSWVGWVEVLWEDDIWIFGLITRVAFTDKFKFDDTGDDEVNALLIISLLLNTDGNGVLMVSTLSVAIPWSTLVFFFSRGCCTATVCRKICLWESTVWVLGFISM